VAESTILVSHPITRWLLYSRQSIQIANMNGGKWPSESYGGTFGFTLNLSVFSLYRILNSFGFLTFWKRSDGNVAIVTWFSHIAFKANLCACSGTTTIVMMHEVRKSL
jgi:hypothetical protein